MKTKTIALAVLKHYHKKHISLLLKSPALDNIGSCKRCYCYHRTTQSYYVNDCDDVIRQTGACHKDNTKDITLWMHYKLIRKNYPIKTLKD